VSSNSNRPEALNSPPRGRVEDMDDPRLLSNKLGGINLMNNTTKTNSRMQFSWLASWRGIAIVVFAAALAAMFASPSASAQIQFQNKTSTALEGINSETWGGAWGDYNGDFWPDILIPNHRDRPAFYRNNGDGTFTNEVLQLDTDAGWLSNRFADHHGVSFADFDGDGDDDVFTVTNGCCPSQLMVSDNEVLTNQAGPRGLLNLSGATTHWIDWNRDGLIDAMAGSRMYLQNSAGNFGTPTAGICGVFWVNLTDINGDGVQEVLCGRDGTFPNKVWDLSVTPPAVLTSGFPQVSNVVDSTSADINNDLKPDLLFLRGTTLNNQAKLVRPNRIEGSFDNSPTQTAGAGANPGFTFNGGGVLTLQFNRPTGGGVDVRVGSNGPSYPFSNEVTITLDPSDTANHGIRTSLTDRDVFVGYDPAQNEWQIIQGTGSTWWMFYVQIDSASTMSNVVTQGLRPADQGIRPNIYVNQGNGFSNNTFASGFAQDIYKCNSLVAEDFDNDMDVDLFFACTDGVENLPNRVFVNDGTGSFTEIANGAGARGVTGAAITDLAGSSEIALTADYDNDGFMDVFVTNGINTQPTRIGGPHQIFRNAGNSNNWVEVELRGTTSNAPAVGATVFATAGGVTQMREYNGGYHRWSQNYKRVHFGLANNSSVNFEVIWPNGNTETFNGNAANSLYLITEGSGISAVNPGAVASFPAPTSGDECGVPSYNTALDRALFVYKDCASGEWSVRGVGGGAGPTTYAGSLSTSQSYSNVTPFSIEGADVLNIGASNIGFVLKMSGAGVDGFDFNVTSGADNCLTMGANNSRPVYLGSDHVRISTPFDLETLGSCGPVANSTFSVESTSVAESVGQATVTVSLSAASSSATQVRLATTSGGTATPGSDYYGTFKILNFPAGQTTQTASFTVVDDTTSESSETVKVRIFAPVGATIQNANATVTIADNDSGVRTINIQPLTVSEGAGTANAVVTLSSAATSPVTVGFATTTGGTATKGSDYYGRYKLVTFPAGSTSQTVAITLVNDNTAEPTETLRVRVFNPSGATIGTPTGTITINDDD